MDTRTIVLIFVWLQKISEINVQCDCPPNVYRDVKGFGLDCSYRCNCVDNAQCNETGECSSGCRKGWMGPACQYRNIADGITQQNQQPRSTNDNDYAKQAVDGNPETCSRTGSGTGRRFWHADFPTMRYLVGFVLKIKQADVGRFRGFSVEVKNNTEKTETCYTHGENNDGEISMDISCFYPMVGNAVEILLKPNETGALSLCEVEIYGGRLVSFNKPTDMRTTLNYNEKWNSSYAVDGRFPLKGEDQNIANNRTCAATDDTKDKTFSNWWHVNLTNTYNIQALYFYGRLEHLEQFNSFEVSVEETKKGLFSANSTNIDDFHPKAYNLSWPVDGITLKINRSKSSILVVCEFEVFGDCPFQLCGWGCNKTCMCNNQTTGIHKIKGTCPYGCTARWTGQGGKCDTECENEMWGSYCNKTCGHCEGGAPCNVINGNCPGRCQRGYNPQQCIKVCDYGKFGDQCNENCGHCSSEETCHHVNGSCLNGCSAGYKEMDCKKVCDFGTFGDNCSEQCGHCVGEKKCNHINGTCQHGCEAGYQGQTCKKECDNGTYGEGCSSKCGHCVNGTKCYHVNGTCLTGCATGYRGHLCNTECENGTYGERCSSKCGHCVRGTQCHHVNGTCFTGCEPGYQGHSCDTECEHGFFGDECSGKCGQCRDGKTCNHVTGTCLSGCAAGYQDIDCKRACSNGMFGENCEEICGNCIGHCNTTTGVCTSGCSVGYIGALCKEKLPASNYQLIGALVGTIIGIVVVAAVTIGIRFWKKRKDLWQNQTTSKEKTVFSRAASSDNKPELLEEVQVQNSSSAEAGLDAVYRNANGEILYPEETIYVSKLRALCLEANQDPEFLYKDFKELPYGLHGDASEAKNHVYKSKNRYKDMYPYNINRVHLPEISGSPSSTYINASYIDGYARTKQYIAAQGALRTTVDDIWRMVWSESITCIVMLTNCLELGKLKCEKYWPDVEQRIYGDMSVDLLSTDEYADFQIRTFICKHIHSKVTRRVTQYHYTAWPDKDVPETALSIVQFWHRVSADASTNDTNNAPWLVHCSAGVGRTGTFIALDYLYVQGKAEGRVNIKEAVYKLRQQRLNLVQTKEQYVLLHEMIAEILDPIGTVCSCDDFQTKFLPLVSNKATNKQELFNEYQKFSNDELKDDGSIGIYGNIIPEATKNSASSKRPENLQKSRNLDIYPDERHRPRLGMTVAGTNDFINAVYISTYRQRDRLILTQCPLENTVVDFLRLVWQYGITEVVLLEQEMSTTEQAYWPRRNKKLEIGPFKTEVLSEEARESYIHRTIVITHSDQSEQKELHQFHFQDWPNDQEVPTDTRSFLQLIDAALEGPTRSQNVPLVVQCLDGAKRSGLFCVIYSVLERMKLKREVAIAETVRMARVNRRQIIATFEQYKFCHYAVYDYLQGSNVYANT